jgi:hypothetical protein
MSSIAEVDVATYVEEESMSIEQVRNELVAIGINSTVSSYNQEEKQVALDFLSADLSNISGVWIKLNETAKIRVVDFHQEELLAWINSNGN